MHFRFNCTYQLHWGWRWRNLNRVSGWWLFRPSPYLIVVSINADSSDRVHNSNSQRICFLLPSNGVGRMEGSCEKTDDEWRRSLVYDNAHWNQYLGLSGSSQGWPSSCCSVEASCRHDLSGESSKTVILLHQIIPMDALLIPTLSFYQSYINRLLLSLAFYHLLFHQLKLVFVWVMTLLTTLNIELSKEWIGVKHSNSWLMKRIRWLEWMPQIYQARNQLNTLGTTNSYKVFDRRIAR